MTALTSIIILALHSLPAIAIDDPITIANDTSVTLEDLRSKLARQCKSDASGHSAVQLARLYFDPLEKSDAAKWLRVGLKQARDSAFVRAAQAEFLWRAGSRHDSFIAARHAITLDPDNIDALYLAGRYALWWLVDPDVMSFRGEHRYFPGPGSSPTPRISRLEALRTSNRMRRNTWSVQKKSPRIIGLLPSPIYD